MNIAHLAAREILDSAGHPTIEAEVTLDDGSKALGQVPSGASRGETEAMELRDGGERYSGLGVRQAIEKVQELSSVLVGRDACDQGLIDHLMIEADGTPQKSKLGGNTILAVSLAVCRASARSQHLPLYEYIGRLANNFSFQLPEPLILVMEGGKHGAWSTDIQEYMVMPSKYSFATFSERLRIGVEIYHALHVLLDERGYATGVGLEGAFCPRELSSNEEAFELILRAIKKAGFIPGEQVGLALDAAASEFFEEGSYVLKSENNRHLGSPSWGKEVLAWVAHYPIWSLEDAFHEEDWEAFSELTAQVTGKVQVVGDDLVTTHTERIQKAIEVKAVTAVIIKPNQVGTVTETLAAIKLARDNNLSCIVSHRAGEVNDDFLADLVVGSGATQCKFGAPVRGERVAKYNRLLRIEERLS